MQVPAAEYPYMAINRIPIGLLIHAYSLPPILLVVQFHGGAIGSCNEVQWGITRETSEVAMFVDRKEHDVPQFESLSLF